jgi:glyoxylase-like metal-dependent hydrolase (beta-lactamase superfamily II)
LASSEVHRTFEQLGMQVLQRCWLSSNNIVFRRGSNSPSTVVDTGYDLHSSQTLSLVSNCLGAEPLERIVNTHLHSDHAGGNAALQQRWDCEAWVPEASLEAVAKWDATRLTYEATGQTCRRFSAHGALQPGQTIGLGAYRWLIVAAPGHDPDAVMLFQPDAGVLISGDALWESRLAIIFSALSGPAGFADTRAVLTDIEALGPRIVVPGHGAPFENAAAAIAASRQRLRAFEAEPVRHGHYATRALTMFRMLEVRHIARQALLEWLAVTPIFETLVQQTVSKEGTASELASITLKGLVSDGLLQGDTHHVWLPIATPP